MSLDLSVNPQKETEEIVNFIKTTVKKAGFPKVVVGLSGGVDSSVSCCLAVKALGAENIYVGLFPYGDLNKEGLEDARILISYLKIPSKNVSLIDIKSYIDQLVKTDPSMDDIRCGNIMVRIRMILLYDLSKKYQALVLGTENKTEHLLGYFTRFGDEASDIEPIRHLYKTQVRQLAKYLGVQQKIIDKIPTAGLWHGQTDEGEFGFNYEQADQILYLHFDKKIKKEDILQQGFEADIVEKVLKRVESNDFKHHLPHAII